MAGSIAMGYLAMVGFIETTAGHTVQQPMSVINGMWNVLNLGHAIGAAVGLLIFIMGYRLNIETVKKTRFKEVSEAIVAK